MKDSNTSAVATVTYEQSRVRLQVTRESLRELKADAAGQACQAAHLALGHSGQSPGRAPPESGAAAS